MDDRRLAYLYLLLVFAIWGSLYVASKYVLGQLPPLTVSFLRYLVASVALLPMLLRKPGLKVAREDRLGFLFVGACGYCLSMGAQMLGTRYAGASLASLVNALNPVAIILVAAVVLKEKLTLRKVICVFLALGGTYTVLGGAKEPGHSLGILLSLMSVLTWAFVSVTLRRLTQRYDPLKVTALCILIGMVCTLPFALAELHRAPHLRLTPGALVAILYMGLACTALAHVLWSKCLSVLEAGTCSLFYPIQPLVSAGLGILALGEHLSTSFLVGGAFIATGVVLSLTGKRTRKLAPDEAC